MTARLHTIVALVTDPELAIGDVGDHFGEGADRGHSAEGVVLFGHFRGGG